MNIYCTKKAHGKLSKVITGVVATLLLTSVATVSQVAYADSKKITVQTANMHDADDAFVELGGAGILTRSANEVWTTISTSGLDLGAYSVWWVVFNRPGNCSAGTGPDPDAKCGAGDLGNADVAASVFYATGFVTTTGAVHLDAHLKSGSIPKGADIAVGRGGIGLDNGVRPGLRRGNGLKAEIHMVVRSHGEIIPGRVDEQTGSLNGGCNPAANPPDPNVCADLQAVAFPPARHRSS